MSLFAEHGYDGVTIEDICNGAGVAKATFFLHFENKAALLQDFNDEITQSPAERLAGHEGSVEDQLLRSEGHTSALQSLMRHTHAVICLTKKTHTHTSENIL